MDTENQNAEEPKIKSPEIENVTASELVLEDQDIFPGNPKPLEEPVKGAPVEVVQTEEVKSKRGGARLGAGRPRKDGTKPAQDPKTQSSGPVFEKAIQKEPEKPVDYAALAQLMFVIGTSTLAQIFGPEWLPRPRTPEQQRPGLAPIPAVPGEEDMIMPPLAKYLETQGVKDIPPGVMLCIVLGAYVAPRLNAPNTREKLKGVWYWIRSKFPKKKKVDVVESPTARAT
jgi:hypothetical protein